MWGMSGVLPSQWQAIILILSLSLFIPSRQTYANRILLAVVIQTSDVILICIYSTRVMTISL